MGSFSGGGESVHIGTAGHTSGRDEGDGELRGQLPDHDCAGRRGREDSREHQLKRVCAAKDGRVLGSEAE